MKIGKLAVLVLVALLAALVAWTPPPAASATNAGACPDLLITPGDLGPGIVTFDVRLNTRPGASWCHRQYLHGRAGRSWMEIDGYLALVTLASIWPDSATAARELALLRQELILDRDGVELPLSLAAEEVYSAIVWSSEPFDPAEQVILLRAGNRVGGLLLATQGRTDRLDELLPLAELAVARLKG